MKTREITNWQIFKRRNNLLDNKSTAVFLRGIIEENGFPVEIDCTSEVMSIDFKKKVVITKHTNYILK